MKAFCLNLSMTQELERERERVCLWRVSTPEENEIKIFVLDWHNNNLTSFAFLEWKRINKLPNKRRIRTIFSQILV